MAPPIPIAFQIKVHLLHLMISGMLATLQLSKYQVVLIMKMKVVSDLKFNNVLYDFGSKMELSSCVGIQTVITAINIAH